MCLWILTACLGLLPGNPSPVVVVTGVPSPIIVPTAAPTTTTTTLAPTTIPTTVPTQPPTTTTTTTTTPLPTTLPPTTTTTTPAPTTTTPPPVITTVNPNIGGFLVPLVICSNPTAVCLYNPNESSTGVLPIDPRLGTTPPSAAIKLPSISGYSAPLPPYDSAVKFPRSRRNVNNKYVKNITDVFSSIKKKDGTHNITKRQSCACVLAGTCIRNVIDIRIVTPPGLCSAGQEYCCGNTSDVKPTISCGVRQAVPSSPVTPAPGQASFGEFPWQGVVITDDDYYGGGVLIDGLNVVTVAHINIFSEIPVNLKVRLGEWDGNQIEAVPYQEYLVSKVIRHPLYNPNTLQNDIAVLRLASAVPFTPSAGAAVTINRACLPPSVTTDYAGQRCAVAGWGFQVFGPDGVIQATIKKVDVPIIDPETCQSLLRTTRLGSNFTLDSASFICAGGEADKDACTGDRGSGLVCEVDGKWVLVGLVAWGIGCGDLNVPGVYVNVATFQPWLEEQIATP